MSYAKIFRNYSYNEALDFICSNYKYLQGDQRYYTCAVSLQFLMNTGRLNSVEYNYVKNLSGSKVWSLVKALATKKGNEMWAYSQHHFEMEWLIKLKKIAK